MVFYPLGLIGFLGLTLVFWLNLGLTSPAGWVLPALLDGKFLGDIAKFTVVI